MYQCVLRRSIVPCGGRLSERKWVISGRIYHFQTKRRDGAARGKVSSKEVTTAVGPDIKASPERKTIAVQGEEWPLSSRTFFHTTEEGVSAVIDEINVDQLSFFAVSTVCLPTVSCRPPRSLGYHGCAYNKSGHGSCNAEPESMRGSTILYRRKVSHSLLTVGQIVRRNTGLLVPVGCKFQQER